MTGSTPKAKMMESGAAESPPKPEPVPRTRYGEEINGALTEALTPLVDDKGWPMYGHALASEMLDRGRVEKLGEVLRAIRQVAPNFSIAPHVVEEVMANIGTAKKDDIKLREVESWAKGASLRLRTLLLHAAGLARKEKPPNRAPAWWTNLMANESKVPEPKKAALQKSNVKDETKPDKEPKPEEGSKPEDAFTFGYDESMKRAWRCDAFADRFQPEVCDSMTVKPGETYVWAKWADGMEYEVLDCLASTFLEDAGPAPSKTPRGGNILWTGNMDGLQVQVKFVMDRGIKLIQIKHNLKQVTQISTHAVEEAEAVEFMKDIAKRYCEGRLTAQDAEQLKREKLKELKKRKEKDEKAAALAATSAASSIETQPAETAVRKRPAAAPKRACKKAKHEEPDKEAATEEKGAPMNGVENLTIVEKKPEEKPHEGKEEPQPLESPQEAKEGPPEETGEPTSEVVEPIDDDSADDSPDDIREIPPPVTGPWESMTTSLNTMMDEVVECSDFWNNAFDDDDA
ncbi:unnamed protein product [Prorocentrum cordatum]|uniref:Uncharacterized protein n=1 Tax=Prorocentrum cordatum TaxID=2364126 RepID=A0ABN9Q467_9DINO|nr:unnamed protein product [Polarella glacialis]